MADGLLNDALLGVEGLLTGASIFERGKSADAQEEMLTEQQLEETERGIQQTSKDQKRIAQTLSQQKADESVSGFSGPTFGAMSKASFESFLKDEDAISMNTKFRNEALEARKKDVERGRNFSIFNSLANFGLRNEDSITKLFD